MYAVPHGHVKVHTSKLEKRYCARFKVNGVLRLSKRTFKTATQADEYSRLFCESLNELHEKQSQPVQPVQEALA